MENNVKLNEQQIRSEIEAKSKQILDVQDTLSTLRRENDFLVDALCKIMRCKYSQFIERAVKVTGKDMWGTIIEIDGFLKGFEKFGNNQVAPALSKLKKDGSPSRINIPTWRSVKIDESFNIQLI